jgi:hypothetical protein
MPRRSSGRSSRVYRSLASMRADFVQVIDNPMIDSAESRGTLVRRASPSWRCASPIRPARRSSSTGSTSGCTRRARCRIRCCG